MKKKLLLLIAGIATVAISYSDVSAKTEDGGGTPPVGEVGGGDSGGAEISCEKPTTNTCVKVHTPVGTTTKKGVFTVSVP